MKVIIIEDESAAAQRLQRLLTKVAPKAEVLEVLDSVEESVSYFQGNREPDLIFMDIQLADGECFEIFKQVNIQNPVIFTTAYDQYAIKAFKVNSIDYLLKPVKEEELTKAIEKWRELSKFVNMPDYQELAKAIKNADNEYKKRFLIRLGQSIVSLPTEDIAYFFSEAKNTFLVTKENKTYTVDESLDKLQDLIDPNLFFRVNRKYFINYRAIDEMNAYSKSRVFLKLVPPVRDDDVIVSTERSSHFKKWLDDER